MVYNANTVSIFFIKIKKNVKMLIYNYPFLFSEQLMSGIVQIKQLITKKFTDPNITVPEYNTEVDKVVHDATSKLIYTLDQINLNFLF